MNEINETEIADRMISIQECEEGYDYTIYGPDYKEIDGGVYDNPDITIREALDEIINDLKESHYDSSRDIFIGHWHREKSWQTVQRKILIMMP